jgi:hypothetical protein
MPAGICLHPLGVPEKEEKKLVQKIPVKPNAGTQHKVQGHNDVCTCDQECDK